MEFKLPGHKSVACSSLQTGSKSQHFAQFTKGTNGQQYTDLKIARKDCIKRCTEERYCLGYSIRVSTPINCMIYFNVHWNELSPTNYKQWIETYHPEQPGQIIRAVKSGETKRQDCWGKKGIHLRNFTITHEDFFLWEGMNFFQSHSKGLYTHQNDRMNHPE